MKICLIINSFSSKLIGGSNVYTWNLVQKLISKKHKVIVITVEPGKNDSVTTENGLTIYRLSPANIATSQTIGKAPIITQGIWTLLDIYNPIVYKKIKRILQTEKPDVAHIHTPVDITLSAFTAVKSLKIPLVFTAHDYLLLCRRVTLLHPNGKLCSNENIFPLCKTYRFFTRKTASDNIDILITPSEFVLNKLREYGLFKNTKTHILPYGITLNETPAKTGQSRDKKLKILYVGSLTRHKGIDTLITAVKSIKNPDIELTIVGDGIFEKQLKLLAADDNRIIFTGKADNNKINEFYEKSDILTVPSVWYEALGIVIQEAFRAGVPVAASNIGGIPEIVSDGYNGFLFEPGNSNQLAKIFEKCLQNPNILTELSVNATESIKKYDMNKHIEKIEEVYLDAINSKK